MRAYASAPAAIANRSTWTVTAIDRHGQLNVTPRPGERHHYLETAEAKVGIALGEVGHTSDVSVGQLGQPQATRPEVAQEPASASEPPTR